MLTEKPLSLASSNAMATCIPKSYPNCSKATLQKVIRGKVSLDSVIYSDGWRGYNGLVDVGYGKHLRVDHGKDEFATGEAHINGIEGFWGFAKTRLVKYRGMHPHSFSLHSKNVSLGSTAGITYTGCFSKSSGVSL